MLGLPELLRAMMPDPIVSRGGRGPTIEDYDQFAVLGKRQDPLTAARFTPTRLELLLGYLKAGHPVMRPDAERRMDVFCD
jgi:hypothetical protein